jgi:hypothetical protein
MMDWGNCYLIITKFITLKIKYYLNVQIDQIFLFILKNIYNKFCEFSLKKTKISWSRMNLKLSYTKLFLNLLLLTKFCTRNSSQGLLAQLVERYPSKIEVTGSILVEAFFIFIKSVLFGTCLTKYPTLGNRTKAFSTILHQVIKSRVFKKRKTEFFI